MQAFRVWNFCRKIKGFTIIIIIIIIIITTGQQTVNWKAQNVPIVVYVQYTPWW